MTHNVLTKSTLTQSFSTKTLLFFDLSQHNLKMSKFRPRSARVRALKRKKRDEVMLGFQKRLNVPGALMNSVDSWGQCGMGVCAKCLGDLRPETTMHLSCGHLVHNGCWWGKASDEEVDTVERSSTKEGCGLIKRADGEFREVCPLNCGKLKVGKQLEVARGNGFLVILPDVRPHMHLEGPKPAIPRKMMLEPMYDPINTQYMLRDVMTWTPIPRKPDDPSVDSYD